MTQQTAEQTPAPAVGRASAPAAQTPTPGQAKAAYKRRRRAEASKAGRPIRRTRQPGFYLAGPIGTFIHMDTGRLMETDFSLDVESGSFQAVSHGETALPVPPNRHARPLTFDRIAEIVRDAYECDCRTGAVNGSASMKPASVGGDDHRIAVVADRGTLTAMSRMADAAAKAATGEQAEIMSTRAIAKALAFRASLPHSGFLPVLTEALAARFWAPTETDERSFDSWADAFGVGRNALRDRATLLIAAASDGPMHVKYVKEVLSAEKYGTLSAQYGGPLSSSKAFKKANAQQAAYQAIMDTDPLLAEFNLLSGEVAKIQIIKKKEGTFSARVSDPFKMKPGSEVLLFDLDSEVGSSSEATLTSVDYSPGDDALVARFSKGRRHGKTWWLVEQASENHRPLYAVALPFVGGGAPPKITGRWAKATEDNQPGPLVRDVPVDVALAGAPETV